MAGRDLGEGTRLAAAAGAWVVFEDGYSTSVAHQAVGQLIGLSRPCFSRIMGHRVQVSEPKE